MKKKIDIINLNNEYLDQTFYKNTDYNIIDLSDKESIIYYCDSQTLKELDITIRKQKMSNISYLGSGNFHYITYLLTKQIKTSYTLILFDNHTDALENELNPYISCGSWVLNVLDNDDYVDKVIIVGVNERYVELIPSRYKSKIICIDHNCLMNDHSVMEYLKENIKTKEIYISIDKDVLRKEDAITNWDNGIMKLSELLYILKELKKIKNVIGVDLCGEGLKRESQSYEYQTRKSISTNNLANYNILKNILGPDN